MLYNVRAQRPGPGYLAGQAGASLAQSYEIKDQSDNTARLDGQNLISGLGDARSLYAALFILS